MTHFRLSTLLITAMALGAAQAEAADNIACMDAGYSTVDKIVFAEFSADFDMAAWSEKSMNEELLTTISRHVYECAVSNNWSPEAIKQATYYKVGSLLLHALENKSPLTSAQMKRLSSVVASADQAKLKAIIGPAFGEAVAGDPEPTRSESDNMFLNTLILRSEIPTSIVNNEFFGSWLSARVMRDLSSDRFTAN